MKKAFKFSLERGSEGTREAGSGSVRFTSLWPGFDSGVRLKPSFLVGLVRYEGFFNSGTRISLLPKI